MTDGLTLKILAEIAAPGSGHLFSRREAARSAIALIEQQAARIAELEAQIATVAPAVDAQPVAYQHRVPGADETGWADCTKESAEARLRNGWFEVRALYAFAQSEGLRKDAERYRYLRRRAVMVDYSDDTVTKLTLFKEEGPTGEFLDDWVDGALSQHTGEKDD